MSVIEAAEFFDPETLENPYPLYARMRALAPVCELRGTRAFFAGSFAAIEEAVLRHGEFSARLSGVLLRGADGVPRVFDLQGSGTANEVIATADEPAHASQRRLLMPPLKASRVAAMEDSIRAFARERVARFVAAGGGDWCEVVSEPLPAFVVATLLGLGGEHIDTVRRWAMMGGELLGGLADAAGMRTLLGETTAMTAFLAERFDRAEANAGSEPALMQALAAGVRDGIISREQAIGILVILFGAAGESTAALLGSALRLLLVTPRMQRLLRAQPERIDAFVEEVVRLESPFKFHYRVVTQDTKLCGTALRAGDRLLLGWASANRDERVFEDADRLHLDRAAPQRHLGFGHGIHFCIGAPLARLEARIALEELLAQSSHLELDAARPARHVPSIFVRRLQTLSVRARAA